MASDQNLDERYGWMRSIEICLFASAKANPPAGTSAELFHRIKIQLGGLAHKPIWGPIPRKRHKGSREQKSWDTLAPPQSVSPWGASEAKRKNDQAPGQVRRRNK